MVRATSWNWAQHSIDQILDLPNFPKMVKGRYGLQMVTVKFGAWMAGHWIWMVKVGHCIVKFEVKYCPWMVKFMKGLSQFFVNLRPPSRYNLFCTSCQHCATNYSRSADLIPISAGTWVIKTIRFFFGHPVSTETYSEVRHRMGWVSVSKHTYANKGLPWVTFWVLSK